MKKILETLAEYYKISATMVGRLGKIFNLKMFKAGINT